jgi:hypothetical protein
MGIIKTAGANLNTQTLPTKDPVPSRTGEKLSRIFSDILTE